MICLLKKVLSLLPAFSRYIFINNCVLVLKLYYIDLELNRYEIRFFVLICN